MICYAVIDTNVLVSALLTSHEDAATVQVLEKVFDGSVIPLLSDEIYAEYDEVLHRKKFGFTPWVVDSLLDAIRSNGLTITPGHRRDKLPDPKDLPFYEVVMEPQDKPSCLVTGNLKHFPKPSV